MKGLTCRSLASTGSVGDEMCAFTRDKSIQMADNSFSDGVPSDSVEAAKNATDTEKLTDQVMQNPRVLAALQERLDNVPHTPSSYIETKCTVPSCGGLEDFTDRPSWGGQLVASKLTKRTAPSWLTHMSLNCLGGNKFMWDQKWFRIGRIPGKVPARAWVLPKAVKRRINALKQLQVRCAHIEAKFYEEVHDLERKYAALYQPLFDKRREFITGDVEPTDAESEWHSENEEEEKLA
ncbi:Nucleosome assembly protein 1-like 4 [Saguinus oedipus]|uniref:Nucleosome assembly protein 1-like 4 n=1 Tax=Saguinus oedipus TaxID=9490 RepID=A0ABQ9USX8_SAGOE|nr:Nucleosome assembly protein 1-like 4 [Saguinus oedipus]